MKSKKAVTALSALAQETRLKIFRELVKAHNLESSGGGLPVGELLKRVKASPPTLSFHLKEMTNAGLLVSRREGRSIIYKANLATMQGLLDYLLEDCCGGALGQSIDVSELNQC